MTDPNSLAPDLFNPVRSEGNKTELFVDGPECLDMILREINNANHFIHIQAMLFYSDHAGYKIAEALADKARQGVAVRVMSDSDMSSIVRTLEKYRSSGTSDFSDLKQLLLNAGVNFVASDKESYWIFNWDEERKKLSEKGVPEEFLLMQDTIQQEVDLNMNVLDHRKILVFDGVSAVVTGMKLQSFSFYNSSLLLTSGKFLQSYARNLRAPALACVQNDRHLRLA